MQILGPNLRPLESESLRVVPRNLRLTKLPDVHLIFEKPSQWKQEAGWDTERHCQLSLCSIEGHGAMGYFYWCVCFSIFK